MQYGQNTSGGDLLDTDDVKGAKDAKRVKTLNDFVENVESIPFTGRQLKAAARGATEVLTYNDLAKFSNVYEVFDHYAPSSGYLALLYQLSSNNGHWVAIGLRDNKKTFEVFDPYGFGKLDAELNYTSYNNNAYLTRLVNNTSGLQKVSVPNLRFQSRKEHVNTCGRHVACRINYASLDAESYFRFMVDGNPIGMRQRKTLSGGNFLDKTVAIMTAFY